MKWLKTQQTANAGVLFVESVVNAHGSIYRPVHQETDVGIDGYIELVNTEKASGRLIAVQIKSGNSYFSVKEDQFVVTADQQHLNYWESYMVPVIIVCYSPTRNFGAWISVRDYIEREKYYNRLPVTKIYLPLYRPFNKEAIAKGIAGLANARADERILLKCADKCLSSNPQERRDGFFLLRTHPDSRDLKITAFFARQVLADNDIQTAKNALFILGYAVGRKRWSWDPFNVNEAEIVDYASNLCSNLSEAEIRRVVELVDDEHFSGPEGLGERCFDILSCCFDRAERILYDIASDKTQPMQRRANALYLLHDCDDGIIIEDWRDLRRDSKLSDLYQWMFEDASESSSPTL
jgi:hypothetical protein